MLRGPKLYPTIAERWVEDVGIKGLTRDDYLKVLRRFQARVGEKRFAEITPDDVRDYIEVGYSGRARADRTRAHLLGIVWQVFDWAMDPEIDVEVTANPAARLRALARKTRRAPRDVNRKTWLSAERARLLITTTRGDGTSAIDVRDAMMIALYLYTGLRLSELIRVRWRDVDFSSGAHGVLHVVRKGGKPAQVPLNPAARKMLFEWRARFVTAVGQDIADLRIIPQTRSLIVGPPVTGLEPCRNTFATRPGKQRAAERRAECPACGKQIRITLAGTLWPHGVRPAGAGQRRELVVIWNRGVTAAVTVRQRIAVRAEAAGIDHLRPHDLRRSFAGMLEDTPGTDMRDIQAALGHAQLATTERYLKQRTKLPAAAEALDFG